MAVGCPWAAAMAWAAAMVVAATAQARWRERAALGCSVACSWANKWPIMAAALVVATAVARCTTTVAGVEASFLPMVVALVIFRETAAGASELRLSQATACRGLSGAHHLRCSCI